MGDVEIDSHFSRVVGADTGPNTTVPCQIKDTSDEQLGQMPAVRWSGAVALLCQTFDSWTPRLAP